MKASPVGPGQSLGDGAVMREHLEGWTSLIAVSYRHLLQTGRTERVQLVVLGESVKG